MTTVRERWQAPLPLLLIYFLSPALIASPGRNSPALARQFAFSISPLHLIFLLTLSLQINAMFAATLALARVMLHATAFL